jgi:hypothetical protein
MDEVIVDFIRFREQNNITDDLFSQYHLEHLLDEWRMQR